MTQKIRTIKRTKSMPKDAKYQLETVDGNIVPFLRMPRPQVVAMAKPGSLRRIVDRDPPKKPNNRDALKVLWPKGRSKKPSAKDVRISSEIGDFDDTPKKPRRKMVRIFYFADDYGQFSAFHRDEIDALHSDGVGMGSNPGPIESALIPEPRRKGKAT